MKKLIVIALFISLSGFVKQSYAHCEIPCGIYGDSLRIELIAEHIETIQKSMNQINELSKAETINYNQLVRWVVNKEDHANKIQEIVSQYFLHQRIKPVESSDSESYKKYTKHLALLHQLSVFAMKAKQSTDLAIIEKLNSTLQQFADSYFQKHDHHH